MTGKTKSQNWPVWVGAFIFAASAHTALALALNVTPRAIDVQIAGAPIAIELALMAVLEPAEPQPVQQALPVKDLPPEMADDPQELTQSPDETRETYREPIAETVVEPSIEPLVVARQPLIPLIQLPPVAPVIPPQVAALQPPDIVPEIAPPVSDDIKPEVALPLPAPVELKKQEAKPIIEATKPKVEKPKIEKPKIEKPKTKPQKPQVGKPDVKKTAVKKSKVDKRAAEKPKTKVDGGKAEPKPAGEKKREKKGEKTSAGKTGNANAAASVKAGNAAASNYPGKVYSKIQRTRQKSAGGSGAAMVAFAVGAGGQITSISLAGSSGNASLDRAALDHVRRAAPFPAPPDGAQTRFNIPIEFRR